MLDQFGVELKEGSWVLWLEKGLRLRVKSVKAPEHRLLPDPVEIPGEIQLIVTIPIKRPENARSEEETVLPGFVCLMNPKAQK